MAKSRRGRGEGSIFQRADGRWVGVITDGLKPNGKPNRKTFYGSTKAEVQKKMIEWKLGKRKAAARVASPTVRDFLASWLAKREIGELTRDRYEQIFRRQIVSRIGDVKVDRLEASHFRMVCDEMVVAGESNYAVAKVLALLRTAFGDLARQVALPKCHAREIRPLTPDQVLTLLEAAKEEHHWLYVLCLLAIDSGMRQGELFALQWSDFDWADASVIVQRNLVERSGVLSLKGPKTRSGRRRIALSSLTIAALRDHQKLAKSEIVFPGASRAKYLRKPNFLARFWKPLVARLGLSGLRFHDLRHTCATLLLLAGENPKVVSERLGHSHITVTLSIYAHVLPVMQAGAARKMDALLARKGDPHANPS